jgi:hypothetical protein
MGSQHHDTVQFRGARFTHADLTGVTIRDCDLTGLQIVDCILGEAVVSGDFSQLLVNDVDVTAYVQAELDRRQPERVRVRSLRGAKDHRDTWAAVEQMWAATHARLASLPESLLTRRVGEEWSVLETMRHLVFATDAWIGAAILGQPQPFHPAGLPAGGYPDDLSAQLGLELHVMPSFAQMLAVRAERIATVAGVVADLTDERLAHACQKAPAPGYPEHRRIVADCLRVVMNEEVEHHRYLVRDLAILQSDGDDL